MQTVGSSRKRPFFVVTSAFFVILLLVGTLCFQYYKGLQNAIKSERREYLLEISKQIAGNAWRTINDNFTALESVASVLRSANAQSLEALQAEIRIQQSLWGYKEVLFVDAKGNARNVAGRSVLVTREGGGRDALVDGQKNLTTSQNILGVESLIFAIPFRGMALKGAAVSALAVTRDMDEIDSILSMSAFSGRAYAHIVRRDGTAVVRSSSRHAVQSGANPLSALSGVSMEAGAGLDNVRDDIAAGKSGFVTYTQAGKRMHMAYTPLGNSEWYVLQYVPSVVVNANSELLLNLTFVLCAVITLVFAVLVAGLVFVFARHKAKLEQIAYVDPVTGGNTIGRFYELAATLLHAEGKGPFALVYVNVEKFKLLNEDFGRRTCNDLLSCLDRGITANLGPNECMGRLFADNFCVLIEYTSDEVLPARFDAWYDAAASMNAAGGVWLTPVVGFGVYVISNSAFPFSHMIDRAKLALKNASPATLRGKVRHGVYAESVCSQVFRERHLESMMMTGLANREFKVHLQPKFRTLDEHICGAEALVRWQSDEGLIAPDEFISLFESNGFIVQLDIWVFTEVCRRIRAWLDAGLEPVKIAVNCSRINLRNPQFIERYAETCRQYAVSPEYLEIEMSESAVFEDVAGMTRVIEAIHAAGFGCSMDDFGSGYSSLNLIRDIPVDTLKLDKVFFKGPQAHDMERTESVVASIVSIARSLSMQTVAEGIDDLAQVEMLRRVGCDFIQGYCLSEPLPMEDFERLTFGRIVVLHGANPIEGPNL